MKKTILLLALILCAATASLAWTFGYDTSMPYLRFGLTADRSIDVGVSTDGSLDGGFNRQSALLRYNQNITKAGPVQLGWGLQLVAERTNSIDTTLDLSYSGLLSVEYKPADQIGFYSNLVLVNFEKLQNGGANYQYLSTLTAPQLLSGVRFYF